MAHLFVLLDFSYILLEASIYYGAEIFTTNKSRPLTYIHIIPQCNVSVFCARCNIQPSLMHNPQ